MDAKFKQGAHHHAYMHIWISPREIFADQNFHEFLQII